MTKEDVYRLSVEELAFEAPKKPKAKPVETVDEDRATDTWVIQCPSETEWDKQQPEDLNTVGCDKPFDPLGFKKGRLDE